MKIARPHMNGPEPPETLHFNHETTNELSTVPCAPGSVLIVLSLRFRWSGVAYGLGATAYRKSPGERYVTTGVRRADLFPHGPRAVASKAENGPSSSASSRTSPSACRGQRLTAGGASVLLSVIPRGNGRQAGRRAGGPRFVRLRRVAAIAEDHARTRRGRSSCKPSSTWKSPSWPSASFRKERCAETIEDFEGKILLARAELERAIDRLNWSRRMKDKGYIPAADRHLGRVQERASGPRPDATRVGLRICSRNSRAPKTVRGVARRGAGGPGGSGISRPSAPTATRPAGLAREASGKLHDPCTARRLRHLRQQHRPRAVHRARDARAPAAAALLLAGP